MKDFEKTSHSYDVTGPDNDGELGVEWDVDTNIIWLSRSDVERMLARFEERKVTIPDAWIRQALDRREVRERRDGMKPKPCHRCGGSGTRPGGWCMGVQEVLPCIVCRASKEVKEWLKRIGKGGAG